MIPAGRFERPTSRIQALAEAGLVLLLLAQAPLWIFILNAGPEQAGSSTPLAIAPVPVPGRDPFFGASSGSDATPLAPHTLYAVRTGARPGAILAGPDGVQKAVGIGETVSDGVTLASVEPDHVMLAHGRARMAAFSPPSAFSREMSFCGSTGRRSTGVSGSGSWRTTSSRDDRSRSSTAEMDPIIPPATHRIKWFGSIKCIPLTEHN